MTETEPMQIVIEPAVPSDQSEMVRLLRAIHETADRLCPTEQAATTLVARDGSRTVGLVMATFVGYGVESYGTIDELVVDASVRGYGIGRELMNEIASWFSVRGCDVVFVSALDDEATAFWERQGFQRCVGDWLYWLPAGNG